MGTYLWVLGNGRAVKTGDSRQVFFLPLNTVLSDSKAFVLLKCSDITDTSLNLTFPPFYLNFALYLHLGIVDPKMKILLLFTQLHVIPNLYAVIFVWNAHKVDKIELLLRR